MADNADLVGIGRKNTALSSYDVWIKAKRYAMIPDFLTIEVM